jgi:hypothetical protein
VNLMNNALCLWSILRSLNKEILFSLEPT